MCALSIKVAIQKKSGNLFNDPHIYLFIYISFIIYIQLILYVIIYIYIYINHILEDTIIWQNFIRNKVSSDDYVFYFIEDI